MADSKNFIEQIIDEELKEGGRVYGKKIHTRFPPEPNGYLHIGHAKALEIDFGTAEAYNGLCNLRMDDTNPTKEDEEYVEAIKEDIHWLGHDWDDRFFYASEYFEKMYEFAIELINKGLAYVCELTPDQMRDMRGDTKTPAVSPYRDRPIEESLDLFKRMRAGEFEDGKMTLRAKIDLASGNFNMRDPVIYSISDITNGEYSGVTAFNGEIYFTYRDEDGDIKSMYFISRYLSSEFHFSNNACAVVVE